MANITERYWYYVKDDKAEGPITESKIKELLVAGHLNPETFVWSESLTEWMPASKVESFKIKEMPSPPPLPQKPPPIPSSPSLSQKASPIQFLEQSKRDDVETVPQVRPWVRHFARNFDYTVFLLIFAQILWIIYPPMVDKYFIIPLTLSTFLWVFIESSMLSSWGTTPGKWLLSTKVRDSAGQKLTFSTALKRSFSVWWRGVAIGLPLVSLLTELRAYKNLKEKGVTTWDIEGGFLISYEEFGGLRLLVMILFFIGLPVLMIWMEGTI